MAVMDERWEDRPAIIWTTTTSTHEGGNDTIGRMLPASAVYWDISPLSVNSLADKDPTTNENNNNIASLSYRQVLQFTQIIADRLRKEIQSELLDNYQNCRTPKVKTASSSAAAAGTETVAASFLVNDNIVIPIPLAVAIPEGPWLALAVTAVHALNKTFPVVKDDEENDQSLLCLASAVLIPLEPTEGRDRLISMLSDARPLIILTSSDGDRKRMESILESLERIDLNSDTPLYQTNQIKIVDTRSLFPEDKEMARLPSSNGFMDALETLCGFNSSEAEITNNPGFKRDIPYENRISHVVFTSGTTGRPKGCVSSHRALIHYIRAKNHAHAIDKNSVILLASAISFDPCLSDILATLTAQATLAICPRSAWMESLPSVLQSLHVSHILCTPTVWGNMPGSAQKCDFPHLRVIALGGEKIPKQIVREWARSSSSLAVATKTQEPRLCATFGVTEACVYQTFGEVYKDAFEWPGQNVGEALQGMDYRICLEDQQDLLVDVASCDYPDSVGEIVLYGAQLDELSGYLKRPDLTKAKYIIHRNQMFYRTGDRGYVTKGDQRTLNVLGRIMGEDGMVKFNGVRIELGEIEGALIDDDGMVIVNAIVAAGFEGDAKESSVARELRAYVVLSSSCQNELGLPEVPESGIFCTECPLLVLLRERCKIRARVVPSAFVLVPRVPLSPTGKRSRRDAPPLADSVPLASLVESDQSSVSLSQYGKMGMFVAETIKDCLNLQPWQENLMTTKATFSMLGGDSLTATRIVRAIYAYHFKLQDSRLLGGQYGILEGPFAVLHLLKSKNLGEYVDWLDKNSIGQTKHDDNSQCIIHNDHDPNQLPSCTTLRNKEEEQAFLYESLLETTMRGQDSIAMALLDLGVDPNFGAHDGRLGKTSNRLERKKKFLSGPLHFACLKGSPLLVEKLLEKGAAFNSPNASGLFPIHLAATGESYLQRTIDEDRRRRRCVELLVQAGVPLFVKDGSRQTVLHAAARGGHCQVLRFLLEKWREQINLDPRRYQTSLDWLDNWSRTAVHWATLHGHVDALTLLLAFGCDPAPPKPKTGRSSAAIESPLELCKRVHGDSAVGLEMAALLQQQQTNELSSYGEIKST